jgi:hypothetical protein
MLVMHVSVPSHMHVYILSYPQHSSFSALHITTDSSTISSACIWVCPTLNVGEEHLYIFLHSTSADQVFSLMDAPNGC